MLWKGLTLTRRMGEAVIIRKDGVRIGLVGISEGRKVRLVFSGMEAYEVNREEIDRTKYPEDYAK